FDSFLISSLIFVLLVKHIADAPCTRVRYGFCGADARAYAGPYEPRSDERPVVEECDRLLRRRAVVPRQHRRRRRRPRRPHATYRLSRRHWRDVPLADADLSVAGAGLRLR